MTNGDVKFKGIAPFGMYNLDLSSPYERAVCIELISMAAADPVVSIASLQLSTPDNPGPEQFDVTRFEAMRDSDSNLAMNKDEKLEWSMQRTLMTVLTVPIMSINDALQLLMARLDRMFFKCAASRKLSG
eukprot:gene30053-39245_t